MKRQTPFMFCLLALACGKSPRDSSTTPPIGTSGTAPAEAADTSAATVGGGKKGPDCLPDGRWALCSLEKRLTQAGFVPRRAEGQPRRRAGFSVAPAVYTLGSSQLEAFVYPNEAAARRDLAGLDTLKAAPAGTAGSWDGPPTFVRSGNLLAVFLTDNPARAERLTLAVTAGPPQPAPAVVLPDQQSSGSSRPRKR